ncbi:MAG: RNA polymerase sigma factor [Planctomycetota bacterium]|jgi:RNA polymerase sigma-70 factor (ECF subfamily)
MNQRDQTDMGGVGDVFLTTHWSLIEDIQSDGDKDRALIGLLLERYWKPIYCCLRRKGYDNEEAKDLTQDFFHEIVLNRKLVQKADSSKGRFRFFLLHALKQYLVSKKRKETARTHIPKHKIVSLDVTNPPVLPQTVCESSPEDCYNYVWVSTLIDQVLSDVKTKCSEQVMETHWGVFHDRIVRPMLSNAAAPSLTDICEKYGIDSEKKASNMIITVKRRFQVTLRQYLRNTVASEREVDDELQEIMRFLPKRAQHSQ